MILSYSVAGTEISSQSNGQSNKSNNTVEEAKLAGSSAQPVGANPYNLEVGSVVQYESQYGVIKWIGNLPDHTGTHAGLEMVSASSSARFSDMNCYTCNDLLSIQVECSYLLCIRDLCSVYCVSLHKYGLIQWCIMIIIYKINNVSLFL